eukprot:421422-Pelagomonas_calceolata.AAC.3
MEYEHPCTVNTRENHFQLASPQAAIYISGEAPFMGREPLGLPASGKVHSWLPWPAHLTSPHALAPGQANIFSQPCDVRGADGALRWPAWLARRIPRPETRHAWRQKNFIEKFVLGWPGGALSNVIGRSLAATEKLTSIAGAH